VIWMQNVKIQSEVEIVLVMTDFQEMGQIVLVVFFFIIWLQFRNKNNKKHQILDLNECILETHNCHANATCTNIPGSFSCTCKIGYLGNGTFCQGLICFCLLLLFFLFCN